MSGYIPYGTRVRVTHVPDDESYVLGEQAVIDDSPDYKGDLPWVKTDDGRRYVIEVCNLERVTAVADGEEPTERKLGVFRFESVTLEVPLTAYQAGQIAAIMVEALADAE